MAATACSHTFLAARPSRFPRQNMPTYFFLSMTSQADLAFTQLMPLMGTTNSGSPIIARSSLIDASGKDCGSKLECDCKRLRRKQVKSQFRNTNTRVFEIENHKGSQQNVFIPVAIWARAVSVLAVFAVCLVVLSLLSVLSFFDGQRDTKGDRNWQPRDGQAIRQGILLHQRLRDVALVQSLCSRCLRCTSLAC